MLQKRIAEYQIYRRVADGKLKAVGNEICLSKRKEIAVDDGGMKTTRSRSELHHELSAPCRLANDPSLGIPSVSRQNSWHEWRENSNEATVILTQYPLEQVLSRRIGILFGVVSNWDGLSRYQQSVVVPKYGFKQLFSRLSMHGAHCFIVCRVFANSPVASIPGRQYR